MRRFIAPTSCPAYGQHSTVTLIITPEADLVLRLHVTAALSSTESLCNIIVATIQHVTTPKALVSRPHFAVTEVPVAGDLGAERLSTQTPTCGTQRKYVFDVTSIDQRSSPWPCERRVRIPLIYAAVNALN